MINNILDSITGTFNSIKIPALKIPSGLLSLGGELRCGLSPIMIASNIIARQSEAGAPFGPASDGGANISEAMERIRVEEIVKALKFDAQIQISLPPGSITITGTGANAGGPVLIQGYNTNFVNGYGVIQ